MPLARLPAPLLSFARRLLPWIGPAAFAVALWLLYHEFRGLHPGAVLQALREIPSGRILVSLVCTGVGYGLLTSYDVLAFRYVGLRTPARRIVPAAFTAYAFSNSAGNTLLTGTPLRFRLYSALGVDASDLTRVVAFNYLTFWLGVLFTGGVVLTVVAPPLPAGFPIPLGTARLPGVVLLLGGLAYFVLVAARRATMRVGDWSFPFPGLATSVAQVVVASLDWVAACLALWFLLPPDVGVSFPAFLGIYLAAQILGLASQVPGGLGVFETTIGLSIGGAPSAVLGSLLVYRLIYYVLPLAVAAAFLSLGEFRQRQPALERVGRTLGDWISEVFPHVLAALVLAAGALLVLTGSIPGSGGAFPHWFGSVVPLGLVEASHFLGSLLGMILILLARGIQRRADAAWSGTVLALGGAVLLTLLRGQWVYAAAFVLLFLFALPCRREFYRRTTLTRVAWSPGWVALVVTVLLGTAGLILFSYRRIEYTDELWWRFALDAEAPRAMRAVVGASVVAAIFAAARLLRTSAPPPALPTAEDVEAASEVVKRSPDPAAHLALLGDKRLLFNADRTAFLMYGVEGRVWVSMGDPHGSEADRADLAWRFREMVDRHGGISAFYEVRNESLGLYVDLGLGLHNIGESARVPLTTFSLEGGPRRDLRQTVKRLEEREGASVRVLAPPELPEFLPRLREISDEWLAGKGTREKGFSMGSFREEYIRRNPVAVVFRGEKAIAFANLWPGDEGQEVSPDLMRYATDAPAGTMEYLFTKLMLWGREEGYQWFNLGMAPLSGLEGHDLAPLHQRVGHLVFRHGEHFYNFQGLRQYKDKWDPIWLPRYVACPSFALPRVLLAAATLIGGGLEGVLRR